MLVNMNLPGKDVLPERELLEKVTTIKRFEYSLLGSELKKGNWYCRKTILRREGSWT